MANPQLGCAFWERQLAIAMKQILVEGGEFFQQTLQLVFFVGWKFDHFPRFGLTFRSANLSDFSDFIRGYQNISDICSTSEVRFAPLSCQPPKLQFIVIMVVGSFQGLLQFASCTTWEKPSTYFWA